MMTLYESTETASSAERALDHGKGILRLAPAWVPRSFCVPGRRIKLHAADYFSYGGDRGGIDERWLSSATHADNGPGTEPDEGVSHIVAPEGELVTLEFAVDQLGAAIVGERLWSEFGAWPVYSKFFDNEGPLPFHVHHSDEKAAEVGRNGKPEAYYFPPELNNHLGRMPFSFLGLIPGTTADDLRPRLANFTASGDNAITELAPAYRIRLGTGWDVPPGILHAPASILTYEPQAASDVFAMFESWTSERTLPEELLWKDVPEAHKGDLDWVLDLVDWEGNTDPDFARNRSMEPLPVSGLDGSAGWREWWVVYRSEMFSAKRLEVDPGATATVKDAAAYGCIVIGGHGTLGSWEVASPTTLRFGELSRDEFFVTEQAATEGVAVHNASASEPLVILKHFGPANPDLGEPRTGAV